MTPAGTSNELDIQNDTHCSYSSVSPPRTKFQSQTVDTLPNRLDCVIIDDCLVVIFFIRSTASLRRGIVSYLEKI